jgi:hypothetical protein
VVFGVLKRYIMDDQPTARREPAARPTEGGVEHSVANKTKLSGTHTERKRGRGRPKGSKNKPKALIDRDTAKELLGVVKTTLPPELYDEMEQAVKSGKNIATINEAKILMKMMGPAVWARLIEEAKPAPVAIDLPPDMADEIGPIEPETKGFDKDLNERLKIYLQIMQFVDKLEKNDEGADNSAKPILEVFARKGLGAARIDFIANELSGDMGGNADGTGRAEPSARAIPDSVSERPLDVPDYEQEPPVRVFDPDSAGDNAQGSDES